MISPTEAPDDLVGRVQDLQERLEAAGDPATRAVADELVSAVVQMYGAGLERIMAALAADDDGERIALALADDPLVATLLMIHDLHPVPLDRRVHLALEQVRPYMESHGGNVELISLLDGVARLRLEGSCSDCSASSVTLELAIKQALEQAAPDLDGLEVEGIEPPSPADAGARAGPRSGVGRDRPARPAARRVSWPPPTWPAARWWSPTSAARCWRTPTAAPAAAGRSTTAGWPTARCSCPSCERMFFLPRAGRSMDGDRLQLDPVPLLRDNGSVKVALPA